MKLNTLLVLSIFALASCNSSESDTAPKKDSQTIDFELIYISNGAVQCEFTGYTPDETAQTLINNGIDVLSSYCGTLTGVATNSVCGASTTFINLHEINPQNLTDAEKLGFASVTELDADAEIGYEIIECRD